MSNGTDPTTFLNYMAATVEVGALTTYGLKNAFGATAPKSIAGPFPFTMRWITRANNYKYGGSPKPTTFVGPQDRHYHVNVFLVLGVGSNDPSTMFTAVNAWMDRMPDAYLRHVSVSNYWQSAMVLGGVYTERQMGAVPVYGIDYDVLVQTIVTPTVS